MAVLASCLTTSCVFVPFFFLSDSRSTVWMRDAGMAICLAVIMSVLVALTLLPLMASRLFRPGVERFDRRIRLAILAMVAGLVGYRLYSMGLETLDATFNRWQRLIGDSIVGMEWTSAAYLLGGVAIAAAASVYVARNGLLDWTPDGSQLAAIAYNDLEGDIFVLNVDQTSGPGVTPVVHEGKFALPVQVNGRWGGRFHAPMDVVDFEALEFLFHPGDVSPSSWKTFSTSIENRVGLLSTDLVDPEEQDWQAVRVPKRMFESTGSIESILFKGNVEGTFYLADMRLIGAEISTPTAVLESHTTTRPQNFALEQNYPNPFNSSTVIRFDIPTSGMVQLVLYNLAGQQIATLAHGVRQAGTHTLHWDGRDDDGRDLASGLYMYRLQAGGQVQMRKLVLIR